jgi:hypothetical protein
MLPSGGVAALRDSSARTYARGSEFLEGCILNPDFFTARRRSVVGAVPMSEQLRKGAEVTAGHAATGNRSALPYPHCTSCGSASQMLPVLSMMGR